jgi:hypothetical protein
MLPNVIVHFKCKVEDLLENMNNNETNDYINNFSKYAIIDNTYSTTSNSNSNITISEKDNNTDKKRSKTTKKTKQIKNDVIPNDAMDYVKAHDLGYASVNEKTTLNYMNDNNTLGDSNNVFYGDDTNHTRTNYQPNSFNNDYERFSTQSHLQNTKHQQHQHINTEIENIEINNKIHEMEVNFHNNNLNGKRAACFWDTCPFDTPAFYIPKSIDNDNVRPYGCFCSLNCALSYLHNEEIDASTKFERRQLLFNLYSEVIGNKTFVKPAPNPRYTLDKYYGNLSIQQWRSLLAGDRMLLIVDKPLTPELPEIHTESIDRFLTMGSVNNNNPEVAQYGKFKIRKAEPKQSKGAIVAEKFGISSSA